MLDRRRKRTERRHEHIAELNKRAIETDLGLNRLYDAIEAGIANLDDPALKHRIDGLRSIRDQAQADATRAQAMAESAGQQISRPPWPKSSPVPPVSASGSTVAAIAAITFAHLPNASRSRMAKSASWDRKAICSEPLPPPRA